jgi:hypothetical protein
MARADFEFAYRGFSRDPERFIFWVRSALFRVRHPVHSWSMWSDPPQQLSVEATITFIQQYVSKFIPLVVAVRMRGVGRFQFRE